MEVQTPTTIRECMFCGKELANRGEAYYDHLQENKACHEAWQEWTEHLDEDRKGGG
jgi:hypothetical protein